MGQRNVLIIDDDVDFAAATAELLSMFELNVIVAHTGEDGIDLAREYDFEFALIDVGLPGCNGSECAIRILSFEPNIKCLLTTGYSDNTLVEMGVDIARFEIMRKPINIDQLSTFLSI